MFDPQKGHGDRVFAGVLLVMITPWLSGGRGSGMQSVLQAFSAGFCMRFPGGFV